MSRQVSAVRTAGPFLGLLLLPAAASALSLGEAQLQSRYGQPLQLRVPVELGSEDEQADAGLVQARLLGPDYYESQGVAPPELAASEFSVRTEVDQGLTWAVITSNRPLREPMLTLFVSVRLGPNRIIREVPLLLEFQERPAARPEPEAIAADRLPEPPLVPVQGVVSSLAAEATASTVADAAALAPPPRKRRRVRPAVEPLTEAAAVPAPVAGLKLDGSLRRPDGYSRFRLDESFASFRQAPPAVAGAATPEAPAEAVATELSEPVTAMPAPSDSAVRGTATQAESGGSWWTYVWLVLLAVVFAYAVRRQRAGKLPHLNIANLPGRYAARFGEREKPTETVAASAPPKPPAASVIASPLPPEAPLELRPEQPAEPVEPLLRVTEPPPVAEPAPLSREGYPNQDLRDRVAQLARQMNTASEKRKLELVKAYIDVERVESAQKLLSELEEKHYGGSRPERLDFELV